MRHITVIGLLALFAVISLACGGTNGIPTSTPQPAPTALPTATSTPAPPTLTPTPTPRPTSTPVPGPSIVVVPDAPPGGEVSVTGGGFTPHSIFTITYLGVVLITDTTTDLGSLSAKIIVPFTAQRGTANVVTVKDETGLSATSDHFVPKAAITLSISEAFAAETISITGTGFPPNVPLGSVTFTSFPQLFSGSPLPTTDAIGKISFEVQAPWPGRSGVITLQIGGIEANAPLLIRPVTIEATRQDTNTVLVVGEGFPPNSQTDVSVNIIVKSGPNIFSDENGSISFEITTYGDVKTPDGIVRVSVGEYVASAQIN